MGRVLGIAVILGVFGMAGQAKADGCCGYGWWLEPGRISPYSSGLIPMPPYYAIHPPVYYSTPVPRSYGWSPFAYPPSVPTPEPVKPAVFQNPFVPKPAADTQAKTSAASTPLVQANPFFKSDAGQTAAR